MSRVLGAGFAFLVSGVVPLLAALGGILFLSACGSCDSTVRQAVVAPIAAGSFDDVQVDQTSHRLYMADQAASGVDVVNIYSTTPQFVRTIDVGGTPNGLAIAHDRHLLYAGLAGGTVAVIDTDPTSPHAMQVVNQITVDQFHADLMDYSPQRQRLYVGAGTAVVGVDTVANQVKERFDMKTVNVEQPRYNPADGLLYVTIPKTDTLLQMNPADGKVTRSFVVAGCRPKGLAINPSRQLAMMACRSTMAIVNLRSGAYEVTSVLPGADIVNYDAGLDRFVAASPHGKSDSSIGVFDGSGRFLGSVSAVEKSHSAAFDDANGLVYAPGAVGLMSFLPSACTPPPDWLKFLGGMSFFATPFLAFGLFLFMYARRQRERARGPARPTWHQLQEEDLAAERERMRALEDAMLGPKVSNKIQV